MGGWLAHLFNSCARPSAAVLALATSEIGRDAVKHDAIIDLERILVCAIGRLHDEAKYGWRLQQRQSVRKMGGAPGFGLTSGTCQRKASLH